MLVITRGRRESVRIGNVTVTVARIGTNYVRLAIDAPGDVVIAREEVDDGRTERESTE